MTTWQKANQTTMLDFNPAALTSADINILAVTIVAEPGRGEIVTYIDHSPEETKTEDGTTRTVSERRFPRRVACPVSAARLLATHTRAMYPHAIVTLVNA
jgi:hypothetical protein